MASSQLTTPTQSYQREAAAALEVVLLDEGDAAIAHAGAFVRAHFEPAL